jgi:hypothetical protein
VAAVWPVGSTRGGRWHDELGREQQGGEQPGGGGRGSHQLS